jgi:hypothetical protein
MASGFTAAQTGRTHDRTRPMLQLGQKVLGKAAPSTHDPQRTSGRLADERNGPESVPGRFCARCQRCALTGILEECISDSSQRLCSYRNSGGMLSQLPAPYGL